METQTARPSLSTKLWTRDFLLTCLSNFSLFMSFQMLIPTLPEYILFRGGDETAVGLVIGTLTIAALLTRPFAGRFLDRVSRRAVLLIGLLLFLATVSSYLWMASVTLVLVIRFVHGIGWGITTTSYGTIIADLVPTERRGEGIGYSGLFQTIAMALAPGFGIWLQHSYGYGGLFAVTSGLTLLAILLAQFIVYPQPARQTSLIESKSGSKAETMDFASTLVEKTALFPSLLTVFIGVCYGGIVTFITLFGQEVKISNVGWFFLANAMMSFLVRPFSGRLFDQKGHVWVLLPGAVLIGSGLITLSYAHTMSVLILAALLFGAGFGATQPSLQAWIIQRAPLRRRGAANGTFFSAFDLGIGAGSMVLGPLATVSSFAVMYRVSSLLALVFLLIYGFYLLKQRR